MRVAKTLAGVVDLQRVRNDAFRVAGAGSLTKSFKASFLKEVSQKSFAFEPFELQVSLKEVSQKRKSPSRLSPKPVNHQTKSQIN